MSSFEYTLLTGLIFVLGVLYGTDLGKSYRYRKISRAARKLDRALKRCIAEGKSPGHTLLIKIDEQKDRLEVMKKEAEVE